MGKRIGPRVIANLVPQHYKDLTALQLATGFAYSTVHAWKSGKADPKIPQLEQIAQTVGVDVADLLRAPGSKRVRGEIRNHPEWPAAVEEAKAKRPNRLPPFSYEFAGETSPARWPDHVTWDWAYDLADFWYRHATDETLAREDTATAQREMDEEDAEVAAALRAKRAANEPPATPATPAKHKPAKK